MKTDDQTINIEEVAALNFEAWSHSRDEWQPPSNVEWTKLANPHLVTVRVAWLAMYKTKPELIDMMRELEESEIAEELLDNLSATANYFECLANMVRAAETRMLCAMSVLGLE